MLLIDRHWVAIYSIIMKNLLIAVSIVFILGACGYNPDYDVDVTNNSTKTVVFRFNNGYEDITLAPGDNRNIALQAGSDIKHGIKYYEPAKKVFFNYDQSRAKCVFFDRQSFKISIINLTGKAGTLEDTGQWMEPINFTASASEQQNADWVIYSSNPNFSARVDGYSVPVLFSLDGDTFKVSI